jgi:hypothetical protein
VDCTEAERLAPLMGPYTTQHLRNIVIACEVDTSLFLNFQCFRDILNIHSSRRCYPRAVVLFPCDGGLVAEVPRFRHACRQHQLTMAPRVRCLLVPGSGALTRLRESVSCSTHVTCPWFESIYKSSLAVNTTNGGVYV